MSSEPEVATEEELKRKESKTKESMALTAISCQEPTSVKLHALYCFIYFQKFIA